MRKYMLTAALVAVGLPLTPAMARQMNGYTVRSTVMRAGPEYDYPAVQRLRADTGVIVYGCLRDWSWCDVSNSYDRGWVVGSDVVVNYQGRRRTITSTLGIGILSFMFGSYWDSHYRSRPFYSQRPRWEQQYNNNFRPEWGTRPRAPSLAPQQPQPRAGAQQRITPQRQAVPQRQTAPIAPRITPRQRQPGAVQRQNSPTQRQVAPIRQVQPNQQAAPGNGNRGKSQAPGQQKKGGQQGNPQDQQNKGHKSQD